MASQTSSFQATPNIPPTVRPSARNWLRPYVPGLYRLAVVLLGNEQQAENVVADVTMRAWSESDGVPESGKEIQWLQQRVIRGCLDELRFRAGDLTGWLDEKNEYYGNTSSALNWIETPNQLFTYQQWEEIKSLALNTLTPMDRVTFLLRDVLKFSTYSVVVLMNLEVPEVNARLTRARQRLREFLRPLCQATTEEFAWT